MKNTLIELLKTYGATGREALVREKIKEMIAPHVDEMRVDALGNLIAIKKGSANGRRAMVAAHMDQIGFVVADIDKDGFLRVYNVGGIRRKNSINRRVVFENGMSGILSMEERDADQDDRNMQKLFVDIGATDRAEAEALVQRGDVCVYAPDVFEMNGAVCGPALDDRAGCALLIEALKRIKDQAGDIIAVFTTQEEVGCRGARAAAQGDTPDVAIALDVTWGCDVPKGLLFSMGLRKGAAVKIMDSGLIATPCVVSELESLAESNGIPYQREVLMGGATDGMVINQTGAGVPTGVISVACRYVHSATEMVDMGDMEAAAALLTAFLQHG